MTPEKIGRREFLSMAAVGAAAALTGCQPESVEPEVVKETVIVAGSPEVVEAEVTRVVKETVVVGPTATKAPTIKYANKACIHHYMTGGFTGPGTDDDLIKQIQEEALRNEYGINVDIDIESATWADFDALLNIRLETKGTDSAERDPGRVLTWMAQEGLIRDLDDVIQEYGKNLLETMSPAGFAYFSRDGKYVGIPQGRDTPRDVEFVSIRRDWCDKVDRDIPQTVEELEEVLRLFKEKNLGGDITIPMTPEYPQWMSNSNLVGPWFPDPEEQFKMVERGEDINWITHGMIEERLAFLQPWYRDGLLNPEYALWKSADIDSAIDKGILGCVMGGWWTTNGLYNRVEKGVDPSQDWVQIYPPLGRKGVPHSGCVTAYASMDRGLVVTSWAECPEAIVALIDWQNKTWENWLTCQRGIEGKHWQWGSGGWYEDLRSDPPNQEYSGMRHGPSSPQWGSKWNTLPPQPGNEPKNPLISERIYRNPFTRPDATVPQKGEYPQNLPIDIWNPYMFTESAKYELDLEALQLEYHSNILKGDLEVVAGLKEFWERWLASGGEVRIREVTDQYSKYISANPEMKDPYIFKSYDHWDTEVRYAPRPDR